MRVTEERLAGLTILRLKDWDGFQAAMRLRRGIPAERSGGERMKIYLTIHN